MPPWNGVFTALVTPTDRRGGVDLAGFRELLSFQAKARVRGVVVAGTTGEAPTLSTAERERLFAVARDALPGSVDCVASTGSNDVVETRALTRRALDLGIRSVMVVEPYYNAPSSVEIRREHLAPLAATFPEAEFLPYSVPARTGTRLAPSDLAILHRDRPNVAGLKDATGDLGYARAVRRLLPRPFGLLCGNDDATLTMLKDPEIVADGVVSVTANLAPQAVRQLVEAAAEGDWATARERDAQLRPLSCSVTIEVEEPTPFGPTHVKSRNPVPIKSALSLVGLPGGACRPPLGRLTGAGLERLAESLVRLRRDAPSILEPAAAHFGVDLDGRLADRSSREGLAYDGY